MITSSVICWIGVQYKSECINLMQLKIPPLSLEISRAKLFVAECWEPSKFSYTEYAAVKILLIIIVAN